MRLLKASTKQIFYNQNIRFPVITMQKTLVFILLLLVSAVLSKGTTTFNFVPPKGVQATHTYQGSNLNAAGSVLLGAGKPQYGVSAQHNSGWHASGTFGNYNRGQVGYQSQSGPASFGASANFGGGKPSYDIGYQYKSGPINYGASANFGDGKPSINIGFSADF